MSHTCNFTLKRWAFPQQIFNFSTSTIKHQKSYEICLKVTIKTPEPRHRRRFAVFIVNFENTSHFLLVSLLLTLSI